MPDVTDLNVKLKTKIDLWDKVYRLFFSMFSCSENNMSGATDYFATWGGRHSITGGGGVFELYKLFISLSICRNFFPHYFEQNIYFTSFRQFIHENSVWKYLKNTPPSPPPCWLNNDGPLIVGECYTILCCWGVAVFRIHMYSTIPVNTKHLYNVGSTTLKLYKNYTNVLCLLG